MESRQKRYLGHRRIPGTARGEAKGERKFPCQSPERTEPCSLAGRGRDAVMWNKCPRAWDPKEHIPQEGNTEAMRHDSFKRVTFRGKENKYSFEIRPLLPRKG